MEARAQQRGELDLGVLDLLAQADGPALVLLDAIARTPASSISRIGSIIE